MDWEEQTQIALYNWFYRQYNFYYKHWHHSPNGGWRLKKTAAKMKAMGTQPGFPDICIYVPTREATFLVVELKTSGKEGPKANKGKPTEHQLGWLDRLKWCNAEVHIAYGYEEARNIISAYMERAIDYRLWLEQQVEIRNGRTDHQGGA